MGILLGAVDRRDCERKQSTPTVSLAIVTGGLLCLTARNIPALKRWLLYFSITSYLMAIFLIMVWTGCRPQKENLQEDTEKHEKPPVEVRAEVDRAEAFTGDTITFSVTLESDPAITVSLPEVGSQVQEFRIIDMGEDGPSIVEGRKRIQKRFRLQADLEGEYILPGISVSYKDPGGTERIAQTGQIFVKVKGAQEKTGQDQDIRDIKPLQKIKREIAKGLLAAIAAFIVILAGLVFIVLRHRKRKKILDRLLPPEELARRELMDLMASGLIEEGLFRDFVFGLSLILRRYLEHKYQIRAAEHTTEEILTDLRDCTLMEEDRKKATRAFLLEIDPIKYRGMEPSEKEIQNWVGQLETFIQQPGSPEDEEAMEEAA